MNPFDAPRGAAALLGATTLFLSSLAVAQSAEWIELTPPITPADRRHAPITFDEARGRVACFGGRIGGSGWGTDTWEFDGANWQQIQRPVRRTRGIRRRDGEWALVTNSTPAFEPYGRSCPGSRGTPVLTCHEPGPARIGASFELVLQNLPLDPLRVPFGPIGTSRTSIGTLPLPIPLTHWGMTDCWLHIRNEYAVTLANDAGRAVWNVELPNAPALVGHHLFVQGAVVAPGAVPLGVITTHGGAVGNSPEFRSTTPGGLRSGGCPRPIRGPHQPDPMKRTRLVLLVAGLAGTAPAQAPITPNLLATRAGSFLDDNPRMLTAVGSTLYWSGKNGSGPALFWHQGARASATEVRRPGNLRLAPNAMTAYRGALFVGPASIRELYRVDRGTTATPISGGTPLAGQINDMAVTRGLLFFAARYAGSNYLWVCDGTNKRPLVGIGAPFTPQHLTPVAGALYFVADYASGNALYRADVTDYHNVSVKRLTGQVGPTELTAVGNKLFFQARINGSADVLVTDGSGAVGNAYTSVHTGASPNHLTALLGKCYYSGIGGGNGRELYEASPDGTYRLVRDVHLGLGASEPTALTAVDGRLFFFANDGNRGKELWSFDPSSGATRIAKDIQAGSADGVPTAGSTEAAGSVAGQPLLVFQGRGAGNGDREIWVSDGTGRGTRAVTDDGLSVTGFEPESFLSVGSNVYCVGSPGSGSWQRLYYFPSWELRRFGAATHFEVYDSCAASQNAPDLWPVRPTANGTDMPAIPLSGFPMDLLLSDAESGSLAVLLAAPATVGPSSRITIGGAACPLVLDATQTISIGLGVVAPGAPVRFPVSDGTVGLVRQFFQVVTLGAGTGTVEMSKTRAVFWGA